MREWISQVLDIATSTGLGLGMTKEKVELFDMAAEENEPAYWDLKREFQRVAVDLSHATLVRQT